jgi:hypothetical protein
LEEYRRFAPEAELDHPSKEERRLKEDGEEGGIMARKGAEGPQKQSHCLWSKF